MKAYNKYQVQVFATVNVHLMVSPAPVWLARPSYPYPSRWPDYSSQHMHCRKHVHMHVCYMCILKKQNAREAASKKVKHFSFKESTLSTSKPSQYVVTEMHVAIAYGVL